jgi:hypothetical protein
MKFLTLYTPATARSGPPAPEQMAKMGAYMQESFQSGVLVATGGLRPSATGGLRVTLARGNLSVENGPLQSKLQQAAGWAILNVGSRDHLIEEARKFLEMAGDGESDMIEIMEAPSSGQ